MFPPFEPAKTSVVVVSKVLITNKSKGLLVVLFGVWLYTTLKTRNNINNQQERQYLTTIEYA